MGFFLISLSVSQFRQKRTAIFWTTICVRFVDCFLYLYLKQFLITRFFFYVLFERWRKQWLLQWLKIGDRVHWDMGSQVWTNYCFIIIPFFLSFWPENNRIIDCVQRNCSFSFSLHFQILLKEIFSSTHSRYFGQRTVCIPSVKGSARFWTT